MAKEETTAQDTVTLQTLQEELARLRQQEHEIGDQIGRLQAEMSRTRGQGRRRAEISRSSELPALQMQQRRVRADLFRVEQQVRDWRDPSEQKE
jgi:hypothetical protein